MLVLVALAFVLGFVGFMMTAKSEPGEPGLAWDDCLYLALQLFVMESGAVRQTNVALEIARFMAPLVLAATAVAAFVQIFYERLRLMSLSWTRGHVVICGLGDTGYALAEQYLREGKKVVIIEMDAENDRVVPVRAAGAVVIFGDASAESVLRLAGARRARALIAVTGDTATNWEIARRTVAVHCGVRESITVFVHVLDPHLLNFLREQTFCSGSNNTYLEFFNIFDFGASKLVANLSPEELDKTAIVIVGLGYMGSALLVKLAHTWYWQRHWGQEKSNRPKMNVWIVDRDAVRSYRLLQARYATLEQVLQIKVLEANVHSAEFYESFLNKFVSERSSRQTTYRVFVCLGNDTESLLAALEVDSRLREKLGHALITSVLLTSFGGLAQLARENRRESEELRLFCLRLETCQPAVFENQLVETLARAFHERYLAGERKAGRYNPWGPDNPTGRKSHLEWEQLEERYKEPNRRVAAHVSKKLSEVPCFLAPRTVWDAKLFEFKDWEVEKLAEMEHERWRREDAPAEHPLKNKGWKDVGDADKEKIREQVRALPEILARAGFDIVRLRQEELVT